MFQTPLPCAANSTVLLVHADMEQLRNAGLLNLLAVFRIDF